MGSLPRTFGNKQRRELGSNNRGNFLQKLPIGESGPYTPQACKNGLIVMAWWIWIVAGLVLMGVEILAVDTAFYLIFIGVAALLMGFAMSVGIELPMWAQWTGFAVLALVFMVFFREKLYAKLRGGVVGFQDTAIGGRVSVEEDVAPGGETRVKMRGTKWTAINTGSRVIVKGSQAEITEVDGLTIKIAAIETST
ncbi:MAG: NfeD family protein [Gammaproteobacteria bacterium]|nr:NfeD family protein [Gammaproteobacteria bacterium]MYC59370.1 NfeD family protein [Gammaproteobacteria bacterium]